MSSIKTLNEWGVTSVVESTYGTFVAPALADGFLASEMPDPTLDYLHDGSRGRNPSGGELSGVGRAGRGGALSAESQMILPGVLYSASVFSNLHLWLRACGFQATGDFTVSAEKYTYALESSGFESVSLRTFKEGQQFDLAGAYGIFTVGAEGAEVPGWVFEFQGIGVLPIDAVLPTITYINGTREPPRSLGAGMLTIGAFTPVLRSWELTLGRGMSPRADDNVAAGHAGFTPQSSAEIRLVVTVEAAAVATYNPYSVSELATQAVVTLVIGSTQFDRYSFNLPTAELVEVTEAEDGATALWELTFAAKASAIGLNDGLNIVTN